VLHATVIASFKVRQPPLPQPPCQPSIHTHPPRRAATPPTAIVIHCIASIPHSHTQNTDVDKHECPQRAGHSTAHKTAAGHRVDDACHASVLTQQKQKKRPSPGGRLALLCDDIPPHGNATLLASPSSGVRLTDTNESQRVGCRPPLIDAGVAKGPEWDRQRKATSLSQLPSIHPSIWPPPSVVCLHDAAEKGYLRQHAARKTDEERRGEERNVHQSNPSVSQSVSQLRMSPPLIQSHQCNHVCVEARVCMCGFSKGQVSASKLSYVRRRKKCHGSILLILPPSQSLACPPMCVWVSE